MSMKTKIENPDSIRSAVSERYASVAQRASSSCCGPSSCCGSVSAEDQTALRAGYSGDDLATLPAGANLGLGCGNPTAIEALKPGETVVDLGSGAGIDVFIAARKVGPEGKVIGVDMTDSMLEKARENARAGGFTNVEFRKGKIEELPVENETVDVIISNCVINLSPEKEKVYREAFRVLKPGGRMMVSDIVLDRELPSQVRENMNAWAACVGGAIRRDVYLEAIRKAGFSEIQVQRASKFDDVFPADDPGVQAMAAEFGIPEAEIPSVLGSVTSLEILVRK